MNRVILCLTTYNRYEILKQSLDSLNKTNFPENCYLFIKDDCSTDERVINLLNTYKFNVKRSMTFNPENLGCDLNVLSCMEQGFTQETDYVFVLDSDAYYHPEWLNKNIELLEKENNIGMAGTFNMEKHEVLEDKGDYVIKKSIGGFSVAVHRKIFENIPKEIEWDWKATRICKELGYKILATKESYSEHLGIIGTHASVENNKLGGRTSNFVGDNDLVDNIRAEAKDNEIKEKFDLIDHDKKIMFMHIPKNAGKSVEKMLFGDRRILNPHKKCLEILKFIKAGEYSDYFKFAVVRNPFSRFISMFSYYIGGGNGMVADKILGKYLEAVGLNQFIHNIPGDVYKEEIKMFVRDVVKYNPDYSNHFNVLCNGCIWNIEPMVIPQSSYTHSGGKLLLDKVIKLEELNEELPLIKDKFNIEGAFPHINKSNKKVVNFDERSIATINSFYKNDLEYFDYKYEKPVKKEKY